MPHRVQVEPTTFQGCFGCWNLAGRTAAAPGTGHAMPHLGPSPFCPPPISMSIKRSIARDVHSPSLFPLSSSLLFNAIKMTAVYSLDAAISSFFEANTTATRKQCDDFALHHAGGPVDPVPIQGTFSYTVTAGENKSKAFQFRTQHSGFDTSIIELAQRAHPQFVPSCRYRGTIGPPRLLHVYEMDNLPGTAYIIARNISVVQPSDSKLRQCHTVKDLARYI